jgi:hypothetical protein
MERADVETGQSLSPKGLAVDPKPGAPALAGGLIRHKITPLPGIGNPQVGLQAP